MKSQQRLLWSLALMLVTFQPVFASTSITAVQYRGWEAYRITNGRLAAIVVPSIGRLMSFGPASGENLLWDAPLTKSDANTASVNPYTFGPGYVNWGGDKIWLAPQSSWSQGWPPDKDWDGAPFQSAIVGHALRMTSRVSQASGLRLIRDFTFVGSRFVETTTMTKLAGLSLRGGLWEIAQVIQPSAVRVPVARSSAYTGGYTWLQNRVAAKTVPIAINGHGWLTIVPPISGTFKLGTDSDRAIIEANSGGYRLVLSERRLSGQYADGSGHGCPVELYNNGASNGHYCELELLTPMRSMKLGDSARMVVSWTLRKAVKND